PISTSALADITIDAGAIKKRHLEPGKLPFRAQRLDPSGLHTAKEREWPRLVQGGGRGLPLRRSKGLEGHEHPRLYTGVSNVAPSHSWLEPQTKNHHLLVGRSTRRSRSKLARESISQRRAAA